MIRSLYYKFIVGYVVFGLLGFLFISTYTSDRAYGYLLREKADLLYDEANQLASHCSTLYSGRTASRMTRYKLHKSPKNSFFSSFMIHDYTLFFPV